MVDGASSSFDPMSSANTTASVMAVVALCCMCLAAYNLGKQRNDRASSLFQVSWWSVPSGACLLLGAMCLFFMYD